MTLVLAVLRPMVAQGAGGGGGRVICIYPSNCVILDEGGDTEVTRAPVWVP